MKKQKVFSSEIVCFIEGIGPKNGQLLAHKVNIKTLKDLREADLEVISQSTGISKKRLSCWRSSAILQKIIGIDGQIAEVLVKNGIRDMVALRNADPKKIYNYIQLARIPRNRYNIIPDTYTKKVSIEKILMWQCSTSSNLDEGYINIWIDREFETDLSTMGSIFIHGRHLYTLEPPERNNAATNDYRTAGRIPCGSYSSFVRVSGINGWCIELKNVPARSNIQIHKGNSYKDTTGCILLGMSQDRNYVSDSKSAMEIIKMEVESSGRNPVIAVNIYGMPQGLTEETEDTSTQPSSIGGW